MQIRAITEADSAALLGLTTSTGVGVTSLPASRERLEARIAASVSSFASHDGQDTNVMLVLEDDQAQMAGVCGIEGAVGLREPWYNYRLGLSVVASAELQIYRRHDILFLTNDLTGSAELCSLFLHPNWRRDQNGALLSKCRFLLMADFPQRFNHRVIAEMRGVSDDKGRSPFWESLGRHFFDMDFSRADYLTGVGNKSFIAELMPQHPVYTVFLSEAARTVIGQVHANTRPALSMLESEGFRFNGYVDIFDAGPTIESPVNVIRAVQDSEPFIACQVNATVGRTWLVSNRQFGGFRTCLANTEPMDGALPLNADVLRRLEIDDGSSVRAVLLSAKESTRV
jgi:arginine N-succinyltransferase